MNHAHLDVDISRGTPYDSRNGVECAPAGCRFAHCIAYTRSGHALGVAVSAASLLRIGLHR